MYNLKKEEVKKKYLVKKKYEKFHCNNKAGNTVEKKKESLLKPK